MLKLIYCELMKLKHSKMIPISILGAVAVPFMMFVETLQIHTEHPEQNIMLGAVYEDSILYMLLLANMMVSVAIILLVSGIGFLLTFLYFHKEDLK